MKKNLLVTLADKNYIDQAKQLFASVYFNAGWKGDYMLLAHKIPEDKLRWFREKGILVKKCQPIYGRKIGRKKLPPIALGKFYLFSPEFKKWNNVIYLDTDIIVRASLDRLTKIKGLAACPSNLMYKKFVKPKFKYEKTYDRLKKNYDLKERAFNSGVMVFNTKIITKKTFSKLVKLFHKYKKITIGGDEPIINLLFYKKWTRLPAVYNIPPIIMLRIYNTKPNEIRGIILHFPARDKPWLSKNPFYEEWKNNLNKANLIDLKNILPAREYWTKKNIEEYCNYLQKRSNRFLYRRYVWKTWLTIDKTIGLIGILLRKNSPSVYYKLRAIKQTS